MNQVELTLELWAHCLVWTLIGIIFYKSFFAYQRSDGPFIKWAWGFRIDLLRGILGTLVLMKLGDFGVVFLEAFGVDFSGLTEKFNDTPLDPSQLSLVVAMVLQRHLFMRRKKREEIKNE